MTSNVCFSTKRGLSECLWCSQKRVEENQSYLPLYFCVFPFFFFFFCFHFMMMSCQLTIGHFCFFFFLSAPFSHNSSSTKSASDKLLSSTISRVSWLEKSLICNIWRRGSVLCSGKIHGR